MEYNEGEIMFKKFIVVGIFNTIFYYLCYSVFLFFFNSYILAIILANIIGIMLSFKTFSKFVFKNKNNKLIIKFVLVYSWNIVLNIILVKIFSYFTNYYIAGFFATGIVALNSYYFNKNFVFKKE